MTKPWKPDEERQRTRQRQRWPQGATAGLVVLGAACLGTVLLLYKLASPKDVFGS